MSPAVVISPEAEAQIRAIDQWWRRNRAAAPDLFVQELAEALAALQALPAAGRSAPHPEIKGLRRILLRAARYHVYYVADDEAVFVLAVWSAVKGTGPNLQRLSQ